MSGNLSLHTASTCILLLALIAARATAEEPRELADWVVETHQGAQISLYNETDRGHTVVTVFWATWCRYCRELLPKLDALYRNHQDDKVTFIAMNIWEDGDPLRYIEQRQLSLPIVLKAEHIARQYGVVGTPAVYVIGPDRRLVYERRTGQPVEEVVAAVAAKIKP